jgi:UDP-N-acetylmuramoylalanine--D-glutamate ligase
MPSAHIIGLGQSGIAAARLLNREGWQVTISDRGQTPGLIDHQQRLQLEGISTLLGFNFDLAAVTQTCGELPQLIVVSPGASWELPGLVAARAQGIEMIGEIELAWRYLRQYPWIGITGTNGKTTTTALTAAIFKAAGLNAPACGNIGYSVCDVALTAKSIDWIIAELSSYQLESAPTVVPKIAIWTTFTPDHLERHGTLERYRDAKALLLDQAQLQVLNADDAYLKKEFADRWPQAWWTSTQGKAALPSGGDRGTYIEEGWVMIAEQPILPISSSRMPGNHNQQNLLMAVTAAHLAGIPKEAIERAIATFAGVPHRLESIRDWQGIHFINDSKATNYDAAQIGLAAVEAPVILIAGGQSKRGDDELWLKTIQQKAAAVLLIGDAAAEFSQRLQDIGYSNYEIVHTMKNAVNRAAELAPSVSAKTVLLSPACASFDQYQNFEQRGDDFRQLCQNLQRSPGA